MDLCLISVSAGGEWCVHWPCLSISIPCDGLSVVKQPFNSSGPQQVYFDGRQAAVMVDV